MMFCKKSTIFLRLCFWSALLVIFSVARAFGVSPSVYPEIGSEQRGTLYTGRHEPIPGGSAAAVLAAERPCKAYPSAPEHREAPNFHPSLCSHHARMIVYEILDPVAPGQTVMVIGSGLDAVGRIELSQQGADGYHHQRMVPLHQSTTALAFVVPPVFGAGPVDVCLHHEAGCLELIINRPQILWVQGDRGPLASPGGWLRFFGKNFIPMGEAGERQMVLVGDSGEQYRLEASVEPFAGRLQLPVSLASGSYRLRFAEESDTRERTAVLIAVGRREKPQELMVHARDVGVVGDGRMDDSQAIQQALDTIGEQGGGTLFLPRGRYRLTRALRMPRNTVLRGDGRETTALYWSLPETPPEAVIAGTSHFSLQELTIYVDNHKHVIAANLGDVADSGHVSLRGLRVRANVYRGRLPPEEVDTLFRRSLRYSTGGGDTVRLGGPQVTIVDCDFYGSGRSLYLSRVRGGLIAGNVFTNGRRGWYSISGSDGVIFEDNLVIGGDLMATGGGINCLDGSSSSEHVYVANNRFSQMHGWDREALTTDGGGQYYLGSVVMADGSTLELEDSAVDDKGDWRGAGVFIVAGRGVGQYRRVVEHNHRRLVLDRPWQVFPDASSRIAVTMFQGHYLIVGNSFVDTGPVQFFGTTIGSIMAGNTGSRMAGFMARGLWYQGFQPSWYNQFLDNGIVDGNYYSDNRVRPAIIGVDGRFGENQGDGCRGIVVRGNRLRDNSHIGLSGRCHHMVVENNTISYSDLGVYQEKTITDSVVTGNQYIKVREPRADANSLAALHEYYYAGPVPNEQPAVIWDFGGETITPLVAGGYYPLVARSVDDVQLVDNGARGKVASFSGKGYLRVDNNELFNAPNLTLCLWLKPARTSGRQGIIAKRVTNVPAPLVLAMSGSDLLFEATGADLQWSFNSRIKDFFNKDEWVHLGLVLQAGCGMRLYKNGSLVGQVTNRELRLTNDEPLVVGREAWGETTRTGQPAPVFFEGKMDDLYFWLRPLSDQEVQQLYTRTVPVSSIIDQ